MPQFRQLSPTELERFFLKRGQMDLTEYEKVLARMKSNEGAEVQIGEGETVRRLTVAAKNQGKQLQYSKRAPEGTVVFRVK